MSNVLLSKWEFLADLANTEPLGTFLDYEPDHVETYYYDLEECIDQGFFPTDISCAIVFSLNVLRQFMALDAKQQQQILKTVGYPASTDEDDSSED